VGVEHWGVSDRGCWEGADRWPFPGRQGERAGWGSGWLCRNGREAGNREWRKGPPDVSWVPGAPRVGRVGGGCCLPRRGVAYGRGLRSNGERDPGRTGDRVRRGSRRLALPLLNRDVGVAMEATPLRDCQAHAQ
jgi:hypothetical protein